MALPEADSGTGLNLSSEVAVASYTNDSGGPQTVAAFVRLSSLNGAAATITAILRQTTSADATLGEPDMLARAKRTSTDTVWQSRMLGPVYLKDGEKVVVRAISTNSSDTAAAYTVDWIDAAGAEFDLGANAPAGWINSDAIANEALTSGKFGSGFILNSSIENGAITANVIADAAITPAKFSAAVPANVTSISDDSTAADNFEAMLDGTGGVKLSLSQLRIVGYNEEEGVLHIQNTANYHTVYIESNVFGIYCYSSGSVGVYVYGAAAGLHLDSLAGPSLNIQGTSGTGITLAGTSTLAKAGDSMGLSTSAISSSTIQNGALNGKGDWNTTAPDNASITAIKAKTDNLPASPAGVGSQMNLADSAITLNKFDRTTAFPLQLADTSTNSVVRFSDIIDTNNMIATVTNDVAIVNQSLGFWTGDDNNNILGAFRALFRSDLGTPVPDNINFTIGGYVGTADNTTDSLQAISGATSGLSGANTVVITVDDGSNLIQSAMVRVTNGSVSDIKRTNSSGQVTFNLDDDSWTVSITKSGYTFDGATLSVSTNTTITYSMSLINILAPSTPLVSSTGYVYCYDKNAVLEPDVVIKARLIGGSNASGQSLDTEQISFVSDSNGLAQFNGFVRGAKYEIYRGSGNKISIRIPDTDSFEIPEFIGQE